MKRDAVISECGRYRYRLYREWEQTDKKPVLWIMLNPSTADANVDDPTIRRCIAFSKAWGYGALWVGNLYAFRSTDPDALWGMASQEAKGPDNNAHLLSMARKSDRVICTWGASGGKRLPPISMIFASGLWCLGRTKYGAPRHPLYVKGDTPCTALHCEQELAMTAPPAVQPSAFFSAEKQP